mgnify:CR=1 FL=1
MDFAVRRALKAKLADRALIAHVVFHLGQRRHQMRSDACARNQHQGHGAVQHGAGGMQILRERYRSI